MLIDTHAHLNYADLYGDTDALLREIRAAGVGIVVNVGWNYHSSALAARQAAEHGGLYFAAGFHPSNLADYAEGDLERIAALLRERKGVAVGEIGLDYHYEGTDEAAQKRAFAAQLELSDALGLPFIVHSRDAAADTLRILRDNRAKLSHGGVMHCFSGSPETAKEYLRLGCTSPLRGRSPSKTRDGWTRSPRSCPPTASWRRPTPPISRPSPSAARATPRKM